MKIHVLAILVVGLQFLSCGKANPYLSTSGVCEGYPDPTNSPFNLPYASGSSHKVGQANCEKLSHFGRSRYAYDIQMDIGTQLVAIRGGTVVAVKENEVDGNGCGTDSANYVKIQHADGSVAHYIHLTNNGADVAVNDVVSQGDNVGQSGNTGCSTGPHLHLVVYESFRSSPDSIPITFFNTSSNPNGLQSGESYTAN